MSLRIDFDGRMPFFARFHIAGILLLTVLLTPQIGMAGEPSPYASAIKALEAQRPETAVAFPAELQANIREISRLTSLDYRAIRQRYERAHRHLLKIFPELPRSLNFNALEPFDGVKRLIDPDVYGAPFFLIMPMIVQLEKTRVYSDHVTIDGRSIPLLRVRTQMADKALRSAGPPNKLEPYMPTVNARVFGFSHAQLIPELSRHVAVSPLFDYNGPRQWAQHSRLKADDIFKRPVQLTNFSHSNGNRYAISAHPDVAVQLLSFRTSPIVMTFFLWQDKPGPVPDFVYMLEYSVPSRH